MSARWAATWAGALLVLVSCGDDDGSTGAPATASATSGTTIGTVTTSLSATSTPHTGTTELTAATTNVPSTAAPTTVDPSQVAIDELATFQSTGDRRGLDLFAPLSPAYVYYEGIVLLSEFGEPSPEPRSTAVPGGFRIEQGGTTVTLDDFKFDANGLITDLSRNGVPVSTTVVGLGHTVTAGELTGTVHSVRAFEGDLLAVMQTHNGSDEDSAFYVDSYVLEGRQLPAIPTSSLSDSIRPGVTAAYIYLVEDAALGGTLYGQLAGGTGESFVSADVEVQVPAPGG